jgi:hypothetical protein
MYAYSIVNAVVPFTFRQSGSFVPVASSVPEGSSSFGLATPKDNMYVLIQNRLHSKPFKRVKRHLRALCNERYPLFIRDMRLLDRYTE